MKKLSICFLMFAVCTMYANDAIPIINTVFHGINTAVNVFRPTSTVVVTPTYTPVVVTRTTPQITIYPIVPELSTTETVYLVNGNYMVIRNGVYIPYIVPRKPPFVRHRHPVIPPKQPNFHKTPHKHRNVNPSHRHKR